MIIFVHAEPDFPLALEKTFLIFQIPFLLDFLKISEFLAC